MMSRKPWALGWLVDKEAVTQLARRLNLVRGPKADKEIEVEYAGVDYIVGRLWWPYMMRCRVGDNDWDTELVFAIYVDNKRRSYPPRWIPRSQMLSKKYADKLNELMPLKGKAQWYQCVDGSHTPWRYPDDDDDDEDEVWVDVLHTLPQPEPEEEAGVDVVVQEYEAEYGEYDEEEVEYGVGAEEDLVEFYEDDQELVEYAEEGEEYLEEGEEYLEEGGEYLEEGGEYLEEGEEYLEEGEQCPEGDAEDLEEGATGSQDGTDYDKGSMVGSEGEVAVYDEQGVVDIEDDDSDTVRGDEDADICTENDGGQAVASVGIYDDCNATSSAGDVHRGGVDDVPSSRGVECRSETSPTGAAGDAP
ncbi:uncharacterized protein B0H18DRAFT_1045574 [Fomitopsis serialis]|uniref:uncharacterized protein n=1 Tax=Fomitopsis serialis TaxID=139415 RepID=UPI0020076E3D|nr:uncharacterized protein B0H18DRAFT_1045574 [Neoantrodia serialis]KAH9914430.1 hypothetical protein B0H18DRAFT_1045574 [Neoantrodia serialis]